MYGFHMGTHHTQLINFCLFQYEQKSAEPISIWKPNEVYSYKVILSSTRVYNNFIISSIHSRPGHYNSKNHLETLCRHIPLSTGHVSNSEYLKGIVAKIGSITLSRAGKFLVWTTIINNIFCISGFALDIKFLIRLVLEHVGYLYS